MYDSNVRENEEQLRQFIEEIKPEFDLVMITDYLMESLVLLKNDLCMTLDDIVFFSKNVNVKKETNGIGDQTRAQIKEWQHLDVLPGCT